MDNKVLFFMKLLSNAGAEGTIGLKSGLIILKVLKFEVFQYEDFKFEVLRDINILNT